MSARGRRTPKKRMRKIIGRPKSATTILGEKLVRRMLDPEHGKLCGPAYIKKGSSWQPMPRWPLILALLGPKAAAEAEIRQYKADCERHGIPFRGKLRERVIKKAAEVFDVGEEELHNWLRRSKKSP
jgi:hypothetical protein